MSMPQEESRRLCWLVASVGQQKDKIVSLLRAITGMGPRGSMQPNVFRKFLRMLEQVADAQQDEIKYINEIEAIEHQHRLRRMRHQLSVAEQDNKKPEQNPKILDNKEEPKRPGHGLIWFLALWYLFLRGNQKQKKQQLNAD